MPGKVLKITKQQFEELPQEVKDALMLHRPILVFDLGLVAAEIPLCLSFNGEVFNMESPCLSTGCKFFDPEDLRRMHYHSENDIYVYWGELSIGQVRVLPVNPS